MRRRVRFGLPACVSLLALALPSSALASFSPHLTISVTPTGGTQIGFGEAIPDAAAARITLYDDIRLTADLSAPPGTTIGTAVAKAQALSLGGAVVPLTGTVVVRGADDTFLLNGAQVPLGSAAAACTGTAAHTTFWVLVLSAAGQPLEVPLFVDAIAAPSTLAAFTNASITLCLGPDPKVVEASVIVSGVFSGSPSEYRWRALATPYGLGSAPPDPASTVEFQGLYRPDRLVSIGAKLHARGTALVKGAVTEAGAGVAGATVVVRGGKGPIKTTTDKAGRYKAVVRVRSAAARLTATANVPFRDLGPVACISTFSALGIPCVDAAVGGFVAVSAPVAPRK